MNTPGRTNSSNHKNTPSVPYSKLPETKHKEKKNGKKPGIENIPYL